MTENVPPTASTPASAGAAVTAGPGGADQNATNRGLPYYEKLRRELRDTLQKKRLMDKSMVSLRPNLFAIPSTMEFNAAR